MAHNLSFDLEEKRRGVTARMKAAMESIIHKYQNVGEEEGDFFIMDSLQLCDDKGQLRHQEVAHFGFLQAGLPEDSATCSAKADDKELESDTELDDDDDDDDDEDQPSAVKMLRDFGSRMEHSICSKMICEEGEDGKVRWILQDDVEEDILTTIGDSDSDRGDISGEDEWAESDEENDEENDEERRSPDQQNEHSLEDSRSSAGIVESEEEEELSDSSGISYRDPLHSNTSTNHINQDHKRDDGCKGSTLFFHKSRESMDIPTNRCKDNKGHKKGLDRPTNNASKQHHQRDYSYKEKTMEVDKSRESMDMPPNENKYNRSHRKFTDKQNKPTNFLNGSRKSAGVVDSEDELSDSSGISYEEPHIFHSTNNASNKGHKGDGGHKKKSLSLHESRESVDMPTKKCKDNGSYRKLTDKQKKPSNISTNGSSRNAGAAESEDELSDSSGISYEESHKSSTSTDANRKDSKRDTVYKKKSLSVHTSREAVDMPTDKGNIPTRSSRSSAGVVESEDELLDSSGISYEEPNKSKMSTSTYTSSKDHKRDSGYKKESLSVHKSREPVDMPTNKCKDNGSYRKSTGIEKHNKESNICTSGSRSSVGVVESEDDLSDASGTTSGYREPQKSHSSTNASSKCVKRGNGFKEKTLPVDRSGKSMEMPTNKCKDNSSHRKHIDKNKTPKEDHQFSPLFPDEGRKKTPSKTSQSRDHHKGTDITSKRHPPSTQVANRSKIRNSTSTKAHTHSVKKEELSNSAKKQQSHNNVCMVEEFEDMDFSSSLDSKNRKIDPRVEPSCSTNSGHGTPVSRKSEKHRKKADRKYTHQDVIDLLEEPEEKSEMGNVTPLHHRSFSKAENTDQGVSRRKFFSVPAKRRTAALTSSRDTDIISAGSKNVDLSTHQALCDFLGEQPSDTFQRTKKKVKNNHTPSASTSLQDDGGQRSKRDAALRKGQDPNNHLVGSSSEDSGVRVITTASTLGQVEKISFTKPPPRKERVLVQPFKQQLPCHQNEGFSDSSNPSFNSLSDEYPLDQKEARRNTEASRSVKEQQKTREGRVTYAKMDEYSGEDSDLDESGSSERQCKASKLSTFSNPSTGPSANRSTQPKTRAVQESEESMISEEASQLSTSAHSMEETCSSNADHSIEMEHSDPSQTFSPQYSDDNSFEDVEEQLPSAKPKNAFFNAPLTNTPISKSRPQHSPLTPILKTPGQKSATPCREKKSVCFSKDVEDQFIQLDAIQSWIPRMQPPMVNLHDGRELDLPSPECHQEDQESLETSEENLEEPVSSLPSSSIHEVRSHPKSPAVQTSTPRRDADRPRFSTPKGRKIAQKPEVPSPSTLHRLDNMKLGSPIQKGASSQQDVLKDQYSEEMEVDESQKSSTDWTKQSVSREQRKMDNKLTERKSARESRILQVNTSNSSFSDVAMFSQSSESSGEKHDETGSNILTPRRSGRSNSTTVLRAPKTDPRHNKRGGANRPSDVTRRLNRSEVLNAQTSKIDRDERGASKQLECSYRLRPRKVVNSDEQEVKDSPRKTSSRQNRRYTTARERLTERAGQSSRSVEKRKADNKFPLTASQAKQVGRQRKDVGQWGQRRSAFSSTSETETTSSTSAQQVSSPEVGRRMVTRSQSSSSEIDTEEKKTRGQMLLDSKVKKVTNRRGQSKTVGESSGSAANQKKGPGRRRIISSSDEQENLGTPRKVSGSQRMKYSQGKGRLTEVRSQRSPQNFEDREVRRESPNPVTGELSGREGVPVAGEESPCDML
ncbi:serine-rich adhesin for platelets-like [Branchiostoma floridae]|uniref:Serine-rich adhesin for platelets-like n=1 Tax=Branchiostoma floridae TaxID=7739 RepID=A0A9J7KWZ5_BRAFL|nr:serine-rich adhesin for platelets-like [Branchiostoma floridae]